ncbi:MAG: N-acetylmuramoyl-L-alanine amidase [Renibacterium salmoninarum]|nr:N-acetylmuramoyl-L-alanine amidase [Renibacterium salmoninarum]
MLAIDDTLRALWWTLGRQGLTPDKIVIHWWGKPVGQTQAGILDFFCRTNDRQTSAHYVVSAGLISRIVAETDTAWHAGDWQTNLTSIGIECNPRQSDGDYSTIAELIRDIRTRWGDLPLYPHRNFTSTECPGTYDLARLDALARDGAPGLIVTPPALTPDQQFFADLGMTTD